MEPEGEPMVAEATFLRTREDNRVTALAAIASGEVWQLKDGRAAVKTGLDAAAINDRTNFNSSGKFVMPKTASIVLLDGGRAYWDASASAVHYKRVNDRDFYLGRIVGDAASADTSCTVDINVDSPYDIDLNRDGFLSVPTGTQAAGGFGYPKHLGAARRIELTATNEAQCIDLLSVDRFAQLTANPIVEAIFRVETNGTTSAVDFSLGLANGTSTTDADAITEHVLLHIDGGDLSLFLQSKDGTTTVAATDTTIDAVAGTAVANRVEVWFDCRTPADVQVYVNGALMLGSTVFDLSHATGPMGIIAHVEKTSSVATGQYIIDRLVARYSEQDAS